MSKVYVEKVNFTLDEYQDLAEVLELIKLNLTDLTDMFELDDDNNVYLHGTGQFYLISAVSDILAIACLIYTRATITFASIEDSDDSEINIAYESARTLLERYTMAYLSIFPEKDGATDAS